MAIITVGEKNHKLIVGFTAPNENSYFIKDNVIYKTVENTWLREKTTTKMMVENDDVIVICKKEKWSPLMLDSGKPEITITRYDNEAKKFLAQLELLEQYQ